VAAYVMNNSNSEQVAVLSERKKGPEVMLNESNVREKGVLNVSNLLRNDQTPEKTASKYPTDNSSTRSVSQFQSLGTANFEELSGETQRPFVRNSSLPSRYQSSVSVESELIATPITRSNSSPSRYVPPSPTKKTDPKGRVERPPAQSIADQPQFWTSQKVSSKRKSGYSRSRSPGRTGMDLSWTTSDLTENRSLIARVGSREPAESSSRTHCSKESPCKKYSDSYYHKKSNPSPNRPQHEEQQQILGRSESFGSAGNFPPQHDKTRHPMVQNTRTGFSSGGYDRHGGSIKRNDAAENVPGRNDKLKTPSGWSNKAITSPCWNSRTESPPGRNGRVGHFSRKTNGIEPSPGRKNRSKTSSRKNRIESSPGRNGKIGHFSRWSDRTESSPGRNSITKISSRQINGTESSSGQNHKARRPLSPGWNNIPRVSLIQLSRDEVSPGRNSRTRTLSPGRNNITRVSLKQLGRDDSLQGRNSRTRTLSPVKLLSGWNYRTKTSSEQKDGTASSEQNEDLYSLDTNKATKNFFKYGATYEDIQSLSELDVLAKSYARNYNEKSSFILANSNHNR